MTQKFTAERYFTTAEFADLKGAKKQTVIKWCRLGKIPGVIRKEENRVVWYLIPKSQLGYTPAARGRKKREGG